VCQVMRSLTAVQCSAFNYISTPDRARKQMNNLVQRVMMCFGLSRARAKVATDDEFFNNIVNKTYTTSHKIYIDKHSTKASHVSVE
jgi:hypothetical protein